MKINYDKLAQAEIAKIKENKQRPNILLHACCGPCTVHVIEELSPVFEITLFFNNSNIFLEEEYYKRLKVLEDYVINFNKSRQQNIKFAFTEYDPLSYSKKLYPYRDEREGGKRCVLCYTIRIDEAFEYASSSAYDYVSTVMTISRHKNSQVINGVARRLSLNYPKVKYLYSDFKKNDGGLKAAKIVKECGMYCQTYCGCSYSFQEYLARRKEKNNE